MSIGNGGSKKNNLCGIYTAVRSALCYFFTHVVYVLKKDGFNDINDVYVVVLYIG